MDKKTYHIIQLLFKYYRETLSVSEKVELEAWLAEDKRNRELLKSYEHFSRFVQDMHFYGETDMEKGYDRVFWKIEIQQKKKVNRMRWITRGSVAASLMIVVTFAILWRQGSSEREQYLMKTLASPDRSGVQLQLSDGKTISLAKVLEVKEIDGRNVATNDTAGIVYQNMQEDILREEEIIYNTVITPRGTEYLLTLSDGSRVWLNSDSRLKFPVKFSKGMRRVELVGEGYFEVAKDTSSPFIVNSGKLEIKVTGTSFNIAAYPDEKIVQTTLVSGSVDVSCPECADTESVSLVPNEIAIFVPGIQKIEKKRVDIAPYVAWHEGFLTFHDESLGSIAKKLERWYDLTFEFDQPETEELIFYGSIKRHENISQVLDMLRCTNLIGFTIIDSKTVRVTRL